MLAGRRPGVDGYGRAEATTAIGADRLDQLKFGFAAGSSTASRWTCPARRIISFADEPAPGGPGRGCLSRSVSTSAVPPR